MAKKFLTLIILLAVLGGIAWGIYWMMHPTPATGNAGLVIN